MQLPNTKSKAFEHGVLARSQGYGKIFNPFREDKSCELYMEWLKGWINQNSLMVTT